MTSLKIKLRETGSFNDLEFDNDAEDSSPKSPIQGAVEEESGFSLLFATLCTISEEQNLVITVPVRTVATTAATTLLGTLFGGLWGMAFGFVMGAAISYRSSSDRHKKSKPSSTLKNKTTLCEIINQMTIRERRELLEELLGCLKQKNVKLLVAEIYKSKKIQGIALNILSKFLLQRMGVNLARAK